MPSFSSSLLATGTIASATLRAWRMSGFMPDRSTPSSIGTSPDTVVSGPAAMSTWPERTRRSTSGPLTLRSGQDDSVTSTRPPVALFMPSRSSGWSTLVYCGRLGATWVIACTAIFGPAGTWALAGAAKNMAAIANDAAVAVKGSGRFIRTPG